LFKSSDALSTAATVVSLFHNKTVIHHFDPMELRQFQCYNNVVCMSY